MLLLQEFEFKVKYWKGYENQVAGHLSILENDKTNMEELEIDDSFLDEHVLAATLDLEPWYNDFSNFIVSDITHKIYLFIKRRCFFMMLVGTFRMSLNCLDNVLITSSGDVYQRLRCKIFWRLAILP